MLKEKSRETVIS